jgi:hypothetical protein
MKTTLLTITPSILPINSTFQMAKKTKLAKCFSSRLVTLMILEALATIKPLKAPIPKPNAKINHTFKKDKMISPVK